MRTRLFGTALGVGLLAAGAWSLRRTTPGAFVQEYLFLFDQIRRQNPGLVPDTKRLLDYRPFTSALEGFSDAQAATLARLLHHATIPQLQQAMQHGTLTAEQLTLYYLRRIRLLDYSLNSVVELNPEALTIAQSLDTERANGHVRGPLHGIPLLLKDNIATGDQMRTTAGAAALEDARADRDAMVASRLRQAGAILLGKANMSEWAFYMSSRGVCGYSAIGGQTHHPLGLFEVGGSSSGSAVAVAAELCVAAIGTETSGSLIYPASQHGLVSLKPSLGLVSRDRIIPITDAQDTAGPMTRNVADTAVIMDAITAVDSNDPITDAGRPLAATGFMPAQHRLEGLRVGVVRTYMRTGDWAAYDQAITLLRQAGLTPVPVKIEQRWKAHNVMPYGFRMGVNAYLASQRGYAPVGSLREVVEYNRSNPQQYAPYGQDLLEKALATSGSDAEYAEKSRQNHEHGAQIIRNLLSQQRLTCLMTLSNYCSNSYAPAGLPAVTIPVLRRSSGEPLGLTLFGDLFSDRELLTLAAAIERVAERNQSVPT